MDSQHAGRVAREALERQDRIFAESGLDVTAASANVQADVKKVLASEPYVQSLRALVREFMISYSSRPYQVAIQDSYVLADFGEFLEKNGKYILGFNESDLPHNKKRIAEAFIRTIIHCDDQDLIEFMSNTYMYLSGALPEPHGTNAKTLIDKGVGSIDSSAFNEILQATPSHYDLFNELRAAEICRRFLKEKGLMESHP